VARIKRKGKIRLGMIRCDTHGYYFGIFMQKFDPLLLMKYNKIVHYYGTDWYDETRCILPKINDFEIVACYDYDPETAKRYSETFYGTPRVCKTLPEMAQYVDAVYVGDCDGGGGDHLKLARPFITRGIPTFVDKPFASNLKDAKTIVRLARKHRTPIFNSSILSQVPAADAFRSRLGEILPEASNWTELSQAALGLGCPVGKVTKVHGVVKGVGGAISQENLGRRDQLGGIEDRLAYIIHGISLAINIFGKGVEWVEAMGTLPLEYLHLHLKKDWDVLILNPGVDVFPERCSFYVEAYSKMGAIHSGPIGDPHFLRGGYRILQKFRNMLRTGKPPTAYEDILEHIAVVDAGQIAQKTGKRVYLKDVMSGKLKLK